MSRSTFQSIYLLVCLLLIIFVNSQAQMPVQSSPGQSLPVVIGDRSPMAIVTPMTPVQQPNDPQVQALRRLIQGPPAQLQSLLGQGLTQPPPSAPASPVLGTGGGSVPGPGPAGTGLLGVSIQPPRPQPQSQLLQQFPTYTHQCPPGIRLPCSCASTRYEPVHVTCDSAPSLRAILEALGQPGFNLIMDTLIISNTPIEHLPPYFLQGHATKRLILRNNRLATIDAVAFDGPLRTVLQELEIRNNLLNAVPQTGVNRLQSLSTLVLAKNRITAIQRRAFEFYASKSILRKLDFSANQLQDDGMDSESFAGGLTSLQEINFDKNYFTRIPTESLKILYSIEDLSFGVNQLSEIQLNSLPFANLKSISFEVNRLERVDPRVFASTPNLLYLYLSANNFTELDGNVFSYIPKLKVLAIGNNGFRILRGDSFKFVPGLVRLEMSECRLERIDPGVFQTIPSVQVIVLNKNRLTQIDSATFQNLNELYSLDLKGNSILHIGDRSFANLRSLRHLDLSTNRLSTLAPGTFVGTFERTSPPTTRVLYVYENQWHCDDRMEWFRRWLRDNMDMMIDAPGYPPTVCVRPEWLRSWPVRSMNPAFTAPSGGDFTTQSPLDGGFTSGGGLDTNGVFPDSLEGQQNDYAKLSAVNLTAMVLGIILGVFLLTLLLLMIVRYFVSKNRREMKDRGDDDRRRFESSTLSGYQPQMGGGGSAYPSGALALGQQHQDGHGAMVTDVDSGSGTMPRPRNGYFLNRPWYWWF